MRRSRSERIPEGQPGIWHIVSRCVRRERLLEGPGHREWMVGALASWMHVLAVEVLGYALMGNHIHLILRSRPDIAASWLPGQVRRRKVAAATVADGRACGLDDVGTGPALTAEEIVAARQKLSHPGPMLRAVKEAFARRLNLQHGTSGHVWESRYHDVALLDAGGVLACQVYVDLNPFRANLVEDPALSSFCSARHRRAVDVSAPDAALAAHLPRNLDHPLLDRRGRPCGTWSWSNAQLADLTLATARMIRPGIGGLPPWAADLLPRLGVQVDHWADCQGRGGLMSGNVLAAHSTRSALPGVRMPSDKSGLFGVVEG